MVGHYCTLRRPQPNDAAALFEAYSQDTTGQSWTYLPDALPTTAMAFETWFQATCFTDDPRFYVIFNADGAAVGLASYLRINPKDGVIEVGYIIMSPLMQRSRASTEAMFLICLLYTSPSPRDA